MDKKLFLTRKEIYSKSPVIFWEVSVFAIIFAIALAGLEAVIPGSYLLTFSIVFFPLLFATYITLYTIKFGGTVSAKSTFNIAKSYFGRGNFGCFRLIRNFLHALLTEFIAALVLYFIMQSVFTNIYGSAFTDGLDQLFQAFGDGSTDLVIDTISNTPVGLYLDTVSSFSFSIALIAFVFGVAFHSVNIYLSANIPNATASFSNAIFARFLRSHRKSYRKDFWSLNWPIFVLLPLGMVIGYSIIFLLDIDFTYSIAISSMVGLLCLIPFAPFFFAGMEALFAKYNEDMKKASMDLTQGFLRNLMQNPHVSEEDRSKINELLSKDKKEQNDDNNSQG
mgnify:CR=1 FL=1